MLPSIRPARALRSIAPCLLVASLTLSFADEAFGNPPLLDAEAIHPAKRVDATPAEGRLVDVNPPTLLWPVTSGRDVRYQVRLSQDAESAGKTTMGVDGLRWAMFNPHRKLAKGTWYWQVGTLRKPGADVVWSDVYDFEVDDTAREFVTPPADVTVRNVPEKHPRILVSAEDLPRLREMLQGTDVLAGYTRSAERLVGRTVRGVDGALPSKTGKSAFEAKNFAKWASKGYAAKLLGEVKLLTVAYGMTQK